MDGEIPSVQFFREEEGRVDRSIDETTELHTLEQLERLIPLIPDIHVDDREHCHDAVRSAHDAINAEDSWEFERAKKFIRDQLTKFNLT